MSKLHNNINLEPYHTFGLTEYAEALFEFNKTEELQRFLKSSDASRYLRLLPIGSGSNLLFTQKFDGCLLQCTNNSIDIIGTTDESVLIKTGAGLEWDEFVEWAVNENYYGIENLSLIPGTTGATPVQNIGAYGVEIKDFIIEAEAVEIASGKEVTFKNEDICFGYRDSIFKNELKDKYFITSVTFKLYKKPQINMSYGSVNDEVKKIGQPNLKNVRQAIINIRRSKLPDHKEIGNAGSFFKNPVVPVEVADNLMRQYPEMPVYNTDSGLKKLAAGWLIDQCGLKGYQMSNGASVHDKQALVIINHNAQNGKAIATLANYIAQTVQNKFNIVLEPEVKIL